MCKMTLQIFSSMSFSVVNIESGGYRQYRYSRQACSQLKTLLRFCRWDKSRSRCNIDFLVAFNTSVIKNSNFSLFSFFEHFFVSLFWFVHTWTSTQINSFQLNGPFLYPLKISEKLQFSDLFRRYGNGILAGNWSGEEITQNWSVIVEN